MPNPVQRIDQITAPPVVGRYYLVPTVHGMWFGKVANWPVMGPKHEDTKFFRFKDQHYHLDRRFLAERLVRHAVASPLHRGPDKRLAHYEDPLPEADPIWRRLMCRRAEMYFPAHPEPVRALQASLAGAQCRRNEAGWVCPHRRFSLGSIAPDAQGIITCPLHGLRIEAASGIVVTPPSEKAR